MRLFRQNAKVFNTIDIEQRAYTADSLKVVFPKA